MKGCVCMSALEIKGFSFGFGARRGGFLKEETRDSLRKLRATGTEWISLCVTVHQEKYSSTKIRFNFNEDLTDFEVVDLIQYAHSLGMKVCLKPILNSKDTLWRAFIKFPDDGPYWDEWFHEYTGFLCHYAEIAQHTGCAMFCVGCEMVGTEHKEAYWRQTVAAVRQRYSGPLIYNANHGSEYISQWFDTIDYIGTSAYYPVGNSEGTTPEEEMVKNWEKVRDQLVPLYEKHHKPIVFMEIGCRSAQGCASIPWDFLELERPYSEDEQAKFYSSCLQVFYQVPWLAGFFWWDWSANLHTLEQARTDKGFGIYGKKAEQVLRKWYIGEGK